MNINNEAKLIDFAQRKAKNAGSPKDVAHAQGYAQALCHAGIITGPQMDALQELAEKSYQIRLAEKRAGRAGKGYENI
jgi:hypothetical protein